MQRPVKPNIPLDVINHAMKGDEEALAYIILQYSNYIDFLSTRPVIDCFGYKYYKVDEDIRQRLEGVLMYSIMNKFEYLDE